jgi:hypothetical protein
MGSIGPENVECLVEVDCGPLQLPIGETLTEYVNQIKVGFNDFPGRTDTEVVHLANLIRRIPALQDPNKVPWHLVRLVVLEPLALYQTAFTRGGTLLVMPLEVVLADLLPNLALSFCGVPFGMKGIAFRTSKYAALS